MLYTIFNEWKIFRGNDTNVILVTHLDSLNGLKLRNSLHLLVTEMPPFSPPGDSRSLRNAVHKPFGRYDSRNS